MSMAKLDSWKRKLQNMMNDPWDNPGDSNHPSCPSCESTMNFRWHDNNGDFPIGKGYWECPTCSFKITEDELYN